MRDILFVFFFVSGLAKRFVSLLLSPEDSLFLFCQNFREFLTGGRSLSIVIELRVSFIVIVDPRCVDAWPAIRPRECAAASALPPQIALTWPNGQLRREIEALCAVAADSRS